MVSAESAVINFRLNQIALSTVSFGRLDEEGDDPYPLSVSNGDILNTHSISLYDLDPSTAYRFRITDLENSVLVNFYGILPTLFREGQGVIAIGTYDEALGFQSRDILAKHDESYVPAEVVDVLKASGNWRGE